MKNLFELYTSILASVGMIVDNQGFVSTLLPGSDSPKPFSVDTKRLVLPTEDQRKQTDWSNRIGFHPLLQNVSGGESRVMEKFRDRMNSFSDFTLGMLFLDIAELGVKEEMHKDLTPSQAAYLGPFSDADAKFVKFVRDIVATNRVVKKNFEFVRFSVIKGRAWNGQKRSRVAVMHFPLYEALPKDNKPAVILGHKLRAADVKMMRAMYEFLFPHIREANYYELGSDSKIAPSLEALMGLYSQFIDAVNGAVSVLEPVISTSNALLIVDDWRADLADPGKYLPEIRNIPFLEGNSAPERVAAVAAPQRILDHPTAAARPMAQADHAPVMTAATIQQMTQPQVQHVTQQEAPQVQDQGNAPAPRFKLGTRSTLVSNDTATHQLPDHMGTTSKTADLSYARPAALPPTPPVGALIAQQQQPPVQNVLRPLGQPLVQQQFQQPVQAAPLQQQQPQAMKVPETARLVNGALYIPVENSGVSGIPQGAIMVEGKVMIPIMGAGVAAPMPGAAAPGVGFQPRVGMQQPQITDPAQVPGLTAEEINFYRSNPVMFQNYLTQLNVQQVGAAQNVISQRQNTVPRYLQNAVTQSQQTQFNRGGFLGR